MLTEPKMISVLGRDIQILFRKENTDPKLKNCVGYFDSSKGWIVCKILEPDERSLEDLDRYKKEVLRHEIIHAFLYESGLDACSGSAENWASNEEMVDWFAIQSPKMFQVFQEQGLV
jgi:hypothetical protein